MSGVEAHKAGIEAGPEIRLYAEVELSFDLDNHFLPESRNDTGNISYFDSYDTLPGLRLH